MRQGTCKDAIGFMFYWSSTAGQVAYSWELFVFPLEKTKILIASSYHLMIATGLGMGASVHFSQVWDLTWCTPIEALWRLSQSLWVHMSVDAGDLEDLVTLASSIPSASYVLSTFTYAGFLEPQGDLMETSHFVLNVLRILALCKLSQWVYVSLPTCWRRTLQW